MPRHHHRTYTLRPDGCITVHNACRTREGALASSDGEARPVSGQGGALKVCFAPDRLAWLPLVWADSWVIDLDPDYCWAVAGGPSRKYLWILSRDPSMKGDLLRRLVARAHQRGYPVGELVMAAPLD